MENLQRKFLSAIGFTVVTPTTQIVDYGTEFGVAVTKEGIVDTAVLVGKVEVSDSRSSRDGDGPIKNENRVVTAGQAVTARPDTNRVNINSADFNNVVKTSLAKPFESLASLSALTVAYGVPDRTAGDRRDFQGGVGLDFEVKAPVRIFSLGVFDHLGDGIDPSTSPVVQLWSRDTKGTPNDIRDDVGRDMLASQVFTSAGSGELRLGHRFKPLPKPIELPVGSYSIVAYGLAEGNPSIEALRDALQFGSVTSAHNDSSTVGQAGGTFACSNIPSYYGDTHLSQSYTLNDLFSATGVFSFSDAEKFCGKLFVGHFSLSTKDKRREFIGLEFEKVGIPELFTVRARIVRFDGDATVDVFSEKVNLRSGPKPYFFDYSYDPNYEADDSHAGPEGRLALHIYNNAGSVDSTLFAVNTAAHRDHGPTFNSFGMGIVPLETPVGGDPTVTAKLFIEDVTYSGHKGLVDFDTDPGWKGARNDRDGNSYGWVQHPDKITSVQSTGHGQDKTLRSSIIPIGSRFGDCKPGAFPTIIHDKKIGFAAGTFEYVPQR